MAPATRTLAAIAIAASGAVGCAKGHTILEQEVVFLDPTRPTPMRMDASAEAGAQPPVEQLPDTAPDAAAPPDGGPPPPAPDAGDPPVPLDAGFDASAASDAG